MILKYVCRVMHLKLESGRLKEKGKEQYNYLYSAIYTM